jgi:hypothetical protein
VRPSRAPRRRWRVPAVATAILCVLSACTPAPAPSGSPSASTGLASPSPVAAAWLPSWATPSTPAAVTHRSPLPFCGVEQGAGPGVTVNAEVRRCFLGAYRDGTGAEFASIQMTIEGDPIATIMRTLPGGGVELLIDATQDQYGEAHWRRITCRAVVIDARDVFGPDGCDEGTPIP